MSIRNQNGILAEKIASRFLINQGLSVLNTNYRSRHGEIDLIMQDNETIVFIEVRYRSSTKFLDPVETIDNMKTRKIIRTSQKFLQEFPDHDKLYRYDVVTLTGNIDSPTVNWIKNAFNMF